MPTAHRSAQLIVSFPVYCLDRLAEPSPDFKAAQELAENQSYGGSISYDRVDVQDAENLDAVIGRIAKKHSRLDGLVAAAGVQNVTTALEYPPEKITEVRVQCLSTPENVSR